MVFGIASGPIGRMLYDVIALVDLVSDLIGTHEGQA